MGKIGDITPNMKGSLRYFVRIQSQTLTQVSISKFRLCSLSMGVDNTSVMHINKHLKPIQNMF